MKILISILLISNFSMAQEPTTTTVPANTQLKMTTKDAKKTCKEEGKKGAELIDCMKEKKGQQ
jgi:hypothetical protein